RAHGDRFAAGRGAGDVALQPGSSDDRRRNRFSARNHPACDRAPARAFAEVHQAGRLSRPVSFDFEKRMIRMDNNLAPLTAVAMSGGVASSTVAALLRARGTPVVGLTMQLWNQRMLPELDPNGTHGQRCCSLD